MTGPVLTAAVVVPAARVMVQDGQVDEATAREVMRLLVSPEYRAWRRQVRGAGFCHRPVRVAGQRYRDTGSGREVLFSTRTEPDHALLIRCGNRRGSVCPPCSHEYKGDVWHLLHSGTAGGTKGVPEQVASHPMWFLTVTGPGFGPVHGATCGRGRAGRSASGGRTGRAGDLCPHGRGRACTRPHADDDPQLGEPICPDCYQYLAAVAFNWRSPELWRRFMIALRRRLANGLGMSEAAFGRELRVSYAKVAEFQKRGIVHFHAIIRLDGAGDGYPPAPMTVADEVFTVAVRQAVADATVTAALGDSAVQLGFGEQIDIRPLRHGVQDQGADDANRSGDVGDGRGVHRQVRDEGGGGFRPGFLGADCADRAAGRAAAACGGDDPDRRTTLPAARVRGSVAVGAHARVPRALHDQVAAVLGHPRLPATGPPGLARRPNRAVPDR